jgi:hypothetical protein
MSSLEARLGLGGRSAWREPPVPTQAEATAFIAAMAVEPSDDRKSAINRFVYRLKHSQPYTGQPTSVFAKLDALYPLTGHHEQASRLSLISPGTYTLTTVGGPSFTTDRGWQGDGLDDCLSASFNLTNAVGRKYLQNDNSMFFWSLTPGDASGVDMGGATSDRLICRSSGSQSSRSATTTSAPAQSRASGLGLFGHSRRAADTVTLFGAGEINEAVASPSVGVGSSSSTRILAQGSTFGNRRGGIAGWGGGLTAAEIRWLVFACRQYLRHCGAVA